MITRKIIFIIILFFAANCISAQSIVGLDQVKMETPTDYRKAEPFALQTSIYLLTTKFDKENKDREKGVEFIAKWMSGTPDHSFIMENITDKVAKDNPDILGIFLAALTKFTLENKVASKNADTLALNGVMILLDYCEKKENGIKMTKQLKKLSEARAKGELSKALQ